MISFVKPGLDVHLCGNLAFDLCIILSLVARGRVYFMFTRKIALCVMWQACKFFAQVNLYPQFTLSVVNVYKQKHTLKGALLDNCNK